MKKLLKLTVLLALALVMSCEENYTNGSSNVVSFESNPIVEFVEIEGTRTAEVYVYTGNIVGGDRTYGIAVDQNATTLDPSAYSVPTSVTVPGGTNVGVIEYTITDSNIPLAGGTLVLTFSDIGNSELTYAGSDSSVVNAYSSVAITVQYEFCPPANSGQLNITLDPWPGETTWELSTGGAVVATGGPYEGTEAVEIWCLESGDYEWTLFDSFGDGIVDGGYSITINGVVVVSGDGDFGDSVTETFTVE